jgi:uncharacterized membrane protein YhaH (DUF805 family)
MMDYFMHGIQNYANFEGRESRKQYWMFILFYILFYIACIVVDSVLGIFILAPLFSIGLLIPTISFATRRLHDIGKSGWWQLLMLIPLAGFVLIYFLAQKSEGDNEYGPTPIPALFSKAS